MDDRAKKLLLPLNVNLRTQTASNYNAEKSMDYTRSRNVAANITQKKNTNDGFDQYPQIYRTTVNNAALSTKPKTISKGYKVSLVEKKQKKFKASLVGVDVAAYSSKNAPQASTKAKDKSIAGPSRVQVTFGPKKRIYVSSLLRQSIGNKK